MQHHFFLRRLRRTQNAMSDRDLDWMIITPGADLCYLSGLYVKDYRNFCAGIFSENSEPVLVAANAAVNQAAENIWFTDVQGFSDQQELNRILKSILFSGSNRKSQHIGVLERKMYLWEYNILNSLNGEIKFHDVTPLLSQMRMIKDIYELKCIRNSIVIAEKGMQTAFEYLGEGKSELAIAKEIEFTMKMKGSEGLAFDTIVASGKRSAVFNPKATAKKIKKHEAVIIDLGAIRKDYVSDITRTFAVGELEPELKKIYEIVLEAQHAALDRIRPGATIGEVDAAAREIINRHGYGPYFTYFTGHGIGLEMGEDPIIRSNNQLKIQDGMVFTVEPGIYLLNKGGVRIEDDVLTTKNGCRLLSRFPRNLSESI
nr:Xaa-Pro dipeptidase [uncultured archaeon]CBH39753.1 putative Xaa-Pro dipeptidase [uncultured archaeon]